MEVAAALMLGIAKLEGEISREHKSEILNIFSSEFSLDSNKAKELFASTSYILQSENNFIKNIGKVLSTSEELFSSEQADSTIALVTRIAKIDSDISPGQQNLLNSITNILLPSRVKQDKWLK